MLCMLHSISLLANTKMVLQSRLAATMYKFQLCTTQLQVVRITTTPRLLKHLHLCVLQILLYIARAHHDAGDHLSAKRYLLKALHIAPGDIFLRFNLGFMLQVGEQTLLGWLKTARRHPS